MKIKNLNLINLCNNIVQCTYNNYKPINTIAMRRVRASIAIMSQLSDVQEEIYMSDTPRLRIDLRLNFAKFIILECNGNLNQEINPEELWEKFNKE